MSHTSRSWTVNNCIYLLFIVGLNLSRERDDDTLFVGDDPHFDYNTEDNSTEVQAEAEEAEELSPGLELSVSQLVTSPVTPPPSPAPETSPPSQPEVSDQLNSHLLSKSGSADSAVEATEELLEDLEAKVCSDDEKENVNVCVDEKNMISNCDMNGDAEKRASEECSDRRNLAEIKI